MSFISDMFSGKGPDVNFHPPGFNGGGLSGSFGANNYNVTANANREGVIGNIQKTFAQQANDLKGQIAQWAPGFSQLRTSLMGALNNNRTAAIGDLRENLARRRILGSSFASDAIARADQQYQQNASQIMSQTYLQELEATNQLTQQMFEASRSRYTTRLNEMNLEAGIASKLTANATDALEKAHATQAQLDAGAEAGAGQFVGKLIGMGSTLMLGI